MNRRLPIPILAILLSLWAAMPAPGSARQVLVFAGDTSFGESYTIRPEPLSLSGDKRYLPSMKALLPLLGGAREVLVNLETPAALPGKTAQEGKAYVHWADPGKTVAALKGSGVTATCLANNHTMDLGPEGLKETVSALDRGGIARTGAGLDLVEAERPLVWEIPLGKRTIHVAILSGFEYRANYDEKFEFYAGPGVPGVNILDPNKAKAQVRSLKSRIPGIFVIAFPHWGKNYAWRTPDQARLAHALVDSGVDLVIGHGAHQLQEIERYRGKWILYGLGNFVFHSPGRYGSKKAPPYSLVARLELEENGPSVTKRLRLYPIESDNRKTGFMSRTVDGKGFSRVQDLLLEHTDRKTAAGILSGRDSLGDHFRSELP